MCFLLFIGFCFVLVFVLYFFVYAIYSKI